MTRKYDESHITGFTRDLEKIQAKPTLYIGPTDSAGVFTVLRECMDNAVDEARAGRNDYIYVYAETLQGPFWIADHGVGIPVKTHVKMKISTLTHVLTNLQSSGKMQVGGAYKSSVGCFVGETPIELVDGRTLTMRQLYTENRKGIKNYVWSVSRKTGELRAQPIEKVHKTGLTRKLVRIHLDNGDSFVCTPDHPLYQTSLKKVEAEDSLNRSLISADFSYDKDGYRLGAVGGQAKQRLHRVVAEYYGQEVENRHVHHVDENIVNNEPHNLQSLTPVQHYAEHPEKLAIWMDYLSRSGDEKSALLDKRNRRSWYKTLIQQGKALKVACRLLKEDLDINESNFNQFLFHGAPSWDKALNRFDGPKELSVLATELYRSAKKASKKKLSSGTRFLASLNYSIGMSEASVVNDHSMEMTARRIVGKAVKSLIATPKKDTTTEQLNTCFNLKARVSTRSLCQYIDLDEFVSAIRHDVDPCEFIYSDLSEDARVTRRNKFDREEARDKATQWNNATSSRLANAFLRNLNAMIADGQRVSQANYHERFKNACGNSGWFIGARACSNVGIRGRESVLNAAIAANHKVVRVERVNLEEEVPVYDLTVPIDHNYRLGCGVFVGNTHGVGIKATNALSTEFEVWTYREDAGGWHYTKFARGHEKVPVKKLKVGPTLPKMEGKTVKCVNGTVIKFTPDPKVFKNAKLSMRDVAMWAKMTAFMNAGLKIAVVDGEKAKVFYSKEGIKEYLEYRLADLKATPAYKKHVFHNSERVELALTWADVEGSQIEFFTNTVRNKEEGVHADDLYRALFNSLKPYMKIIKTKGKEGWPCNAQDIRDGMVGLLNYKIDAPQFDSQTKEKLVDDRVKGACYEECFAELTKFWAANKSMATEIVKRASELRAKTADFLKDKALIKGVNAAKKSMSTKLAGVIGNAPVERRELFLVEGDSAGGGAKVTRDKSFQAIYPLRGKPLNPIDTKKEKVNNNAEIVGLLAALGMDLNAKDPSKTVKYGKVIQLADPDVDGMHINCLITAILWKYTPHLVQGGHVYAVKAPLYKAKHKGEVIFGMSKDEIYKKSGTPKLDITYIKGWGEINKEDLEVALKPGVRKLYRITAPDAKQAAEFLQLMGAKPFYRKTLLGVAG